MHSGDRQSLSQLFDGIDSVLTVHIHPSDENVHVMLIKKQKTDICYLFLLVINNIIQKCNIQSVANLFYDKEAIIFCLYLYVCVQLLISLQNKHKNIVFVILINNVI